MKTKDFITLGKRLLPALPGFVVKGQMLFLCPIGHTLRGIFFDRSINPQGFYVQVFIQPLFVPAKHITFNVGWRLGGSSHIWNADVPESDSELVEAINQKALPFLSQVELPQHTANVATSLQKPQDPYVQQAVAYSFARGGDIEQAIVALARLIRLLDVKDPYPWQREMVKRAEALEIELRDNPSVARRRLEAWEAETAKNLGLEKFH